MLPKNIPKIFYQMESPFYHPPSNLDLKVYDNFFDAAMTYRSDSQYYKPYGNIFRIKLDAYLENHPHIFGSEINDEKIDEFFAKYSAEKLHLNEKNYFAQRPNGILGVISNCKAKQRSAFVKFLDSYFSNKPTNPLKILGACAKKLQKPINSSKTDMSKISNQIQISQQPISNISKSYKFYLALENSKCQDYVTEKLFANAIKGGAIPIVLGPDREFYKTLVPEDSFIYVGGKDSWSQLAENLWDLTTNPDKKTKQRLLKFHEWRNFESQKNQKEKPKYRFAHLQEYNENFGFCKLCKDLHQNQNFKKFETKIEDIHFWWYKSYSSRGTCEV